MNKYLFTVRQEFGGKPTLASFYQIKTPTDIVNQELLNTVDDFLGDKIFFGKERKNDQQSYTGMNMAMRANQDSYPHLLVITAEYELEREEFKMYLDNMDEVELKEFLRSHHI